MTPAERQAVLAERKARGYPLHSPPHFKGIHGVYLITAACYEHRHVFDTPDLLSLLADELLASLSKSNLPCRRVWYRYSDRLIRDERHYWATVNYIHYNPIKHRYVELMSEWPWSSLHRFDETLGIEELQRLWRDYSIKDYGRGWDD